MGSTTTVSEPPRLAELKDSSAKEKPAPDLNLRPAITWSLDRLTEYAKSQLDLAEQTQKQFVEFGRRTSVSVFRAGHALVLIRDRIKAVRGQSWSAWQREQGLKRTPVWEAIKLFENARDERKVANLTITEAKHRFGVVAEKKKKPVRNPNDSNASMDSNILQLATPDPEEADQPEEEWQESERLDDGEEYEEEENLELGVDDFIESIQLVSADAQRTEVEWEHFSAEINEEKRQALLHGIDQAVAILNRLREAVASHA